MRVVRSLVLLALVRAAAPVAAAPVVTDPSARTALALTVYSQENLAIVRETRTMRLPAGTAIVRFTGLPEETDPRTLHLEAAANAEPPRVREQSFRWDGASAEQLLGRWVGKTVELVETDEELQTRTTTAELIALGTPPIYRAGDRLLLGHPGRVQLPEAGEDVLLEPTASWTLTGERGGERSLVASYATGGLGWDADYALSLSADAGPRTAARLGAWITLRNDTRASFPDAALALVSGRIHRVEQPVARPAPVRAEMAMMRAGAAPPVEEAVAGQHRYQLPGPVTVAAHETKQVPLFPDASVTVERRYRVTGPGPWAGGAGGEDERTLPVQSRLRLANTQANGLGLPLPAGIVRVEAPTPSGAVAFVGEDRIAHVADGETFDLEIGEASDLVAKWRLVELRETGTKPYEHEAAVRLELRNRTATPVAIAVREPLGRSWKLVDSSRTPEPVDATTLGFELPVPARGSAELTYRVQLGR